MVQIAEAPRCSITDPRGLAYWLAKRRAIDYIRTARRFRVDSLEKGPVGEETVDYDPPTKTADPITVLSARQWADRNYQVFFDALESGTNSTCNVVRNIRRLVEERIPLRDADPDAAAVKVLRFIEARKMVFSGRTADGDKRDSRDVELLAQRLNMHPSAVLTALNRLQRLWRDRELRIAGAETEE